MLTIIRRRQLHFGEGKSRGKCCLCSRVVKLAVQRIQQVSETGSDEGDRQVKELCFIRSSVPNMKEVSSMNSKVSLNTQRSIGKYNSERL